MKIFVCQLCVQSFLINITFHSSPDQLLHSSDNMCQDSRKHNNPPFARLSTNVNPTFRVRTTNYHAFSTQIESTIVMKNFKYDEKRWKIKISEMQWVCVDSHSFSYHRVCQISDSRGAIYCCSAVTNPRCKSDSFTLHVAELTVSVLSVSAYSEAHPDRVC